MQYASATDETRVDLYHQTGIGAALVETLTELADASAIPVDLAAHVVKAFDEVRS